MNFWDYLQSIVIIAAVILAAYYVTRLAARTGMGANGLKGQGIRQVATLPLGKDRSVTVVEIGGYAYVLGVSAQRVELIDKVSLAELKLPEQAQSPPSFGAVFREELGRRLGRGKGE